MPNLPKKRGAGYQVRWKHRETREWQSVTISKLGTDADNKRAAGSLYVWLQQRNDGAFSTDPAITHYAFLRPDQPVPNSVGQRTRTFGEVSAEMIGLKSHVRSATRDRQVAQLRNHFGKWLPLQIADITPQHVADKAEELHGYAKGWSYNVYMSLAKSVFGYAVNEGYITRTPFRNIVIGQPEEEELVIMTHDQFGLLIRGAVCQQTRDIMFFGIQTGCRIGEIFAIRVADLYLSGDEPYVHIHRSLNQWTREVNEPKKRKKRKIRLDPETAAYLGKLVAGRPRSALLFPGTDGGGWFYAYFRDKRWLPSVAAAVELGLDPDLAKGIRPHGLRHTHASWALADGVDIRVLAQRLGHSDPAFTLRKYAHVTDLGYATANTAFARQASRLLADLERVGA